MSERLKVQKSSGNVFADLGFSEEAARNLARRLGITQPRLNALLRGNINQFSLDALVNIATHAGLRVELRIVQTRAA